MDNSDRIREEASGQRCSPAEQYDQGMEYLEGKGALQNNEKQKMDIPILEELDAMFAKIISIEPEAEVYLSGSFADGTYRESSDINLCIVVPRFRKSQINTMVIMQEAVEDTTEMPIEVVAFEKDTFERRAEKWSGLPGVIAREGILLNDQLPALKKHHKRQARTKKREPAKKRVEISEIPIKNELDAMVAMITHLLPKAKVYLYGSFADGTQRKKSDIDLCVVVPKFHKSQMGTFDLVHDAILDITKRSIDVLVYEKDAFEDWAKLKSTLQHTIVNKGKLLNG